MKLPVLPAYYPHIQLTKLVLPLGFTTQVAAPTAREYPLVQAVQVVAPPDVVVAVQFA